MENPGPSVELWNDQGEPERRITRTLNQRQPPPPGYLLWCVAEPDEAQKVLLSRLGLDLPRRLRRLDQTIQME